MPDDATLQDPVVEEADPDSGRDPGTALITGCSSGIGRATALTFREDDWTVYATARDESTLEDLADVGCETAELNVTAPGEIERVVDRVVDEDGRIDALVNNAGYGQFGPVEEVPPTAVRRQFAVNVFGPHRLIRAVLPQMRRQESGTIVNVSSVAGRVSFPGGGVYAGSKFAIEAISDALRSEVEEFGIDVAVVEPGPVESEFNERAESEVEELDRSGEYGWFDSMFEDASAFGGGGPGAIPPEDVADAIHQAASCADPRSRYVVGVPASIAVLARYLPDRARDRLFSVARRVMG